MNGDIASLSSGYDGLAMALGVTATWHAETDPDASMVLKTWWPDVPNLGDFTTPDFWETAERCDLHMGGIPCQPFSAAGLQQGIADARYLWPFWRRGIEIQRPGTVVFENVANLTQGKMRPVFNAIIADLLMLGYNVRWCLLGACAVGAAHHRHRVFLLATLATGTPAATQVTVLTCGQSIAAYLPTPQSRDGMPGGLSLPTALNMIPSPRASDAKNGGPNQGIASGDIALSSAVQPERWGKYAEAIARQTLVLGRPAPEPTEIGPKGGRRLAAAFSEWLMMLPEGHLTSVLTRNPALTRAGNGVVPLQAATAIRLLRECA